MPRQQGIRRHNRGDVLQLLGFGGKPATLIIIESHAVIADLFSKNAIFLHEIFDDVLLMQVHPSGNRDHNK